jgi:hypothetical protein
MVACIHAVCSEERNSWMPDQNGRVTLRLSSLRQGMPGLSPAWGSVLAESAAVCLEDQGHGMVSVLSVDGSFEETFLLERSVVDQQIRSSHLDEQEATEKGACGVALLVVRHLTGNVVLWRSRKGTGFDYWIAPEESASIQSGERLEVSGIRRGSEALVRARVTEKVRQAQRFQTAGPALIAVAEFSQPRLRLVKVHRPKLRIVKP